MGLYRVTEQRTVYVAARNDEEAQDIAILVGLDDVPYNARATRIYSADRIDVGWVARRPYVFAEDGDAALGDVTCAEAVKREREG